MRILCSPFNSLFQPLQVYFSLLLNLKAHLNSFTKTKSKKCQSCTHNGCIYPFGRHKMWHEAISFKHLTNIYGIKLKVGARVLISAMGHRRSMDWFRILLEQKFLRIRNNIINRLSIEIWNIFNQFKESLANLIQ